jgi:hypothetical protein
MNTKAERSEVIGNVTIVSRHGIEAELHRLRKAVEGLPPHLRSDVAELFADSKHSVHNVTLRAPGNAPQIAAELFRLRSFVSFDCRGVRVLETSSH